MDGTDFMGDLVKKALITAAGTAGSKLGSTAAAYVLEIIGLGDTDDLAEIRAELDSISTQVQQTDSKLTALMDEVKWANATDSFDSICASIVTHNSNLQTLLAIPDAATRDAQVNKYILGHSSLDDLDTSLTLIDARIMGKSGGITGTYKESLMKTFLDTHWDSVKDPSPATSYQNILAVYLQAAQMQRLAATLVVAYREATGQPQLAQALRDHIETRLAAQLQVLAQVGPDFVMVNALETPDVQLDFTGFQIAPAYVALLNAQLIPSDTPPAANVWALRRNGVDPTVPEYMLILANAMVVAEQVQQVAVNEYSVTTSGRDITHYDYETGHFLGMSVLGDSTITPLRFSIEVTDQKDVLRWVLADGRTLGYLDRGYSSYTFELTDADATPANGLVTCTGYSKTPVVGQPTLSAWSRTFQGNPTGEGRFSPGYRVRYRASHLNRFGESDKSDWLLAPKSEDSQDSEGYFGNDAFYFPQILLAVDPAGRTEGYRIFRQFKGGPEEEVTTGTYTGAAQSGKPVIFDDFMP